VLIDGGVMWISKKKYNELVAERDNYNRIASETIQLNGRVIDSNARILEEMKGIQELNHCLQQRNEELLAHIEELGVKLDFVIKQRDYYYDLLESTSEVEEKDE
jgi:predicted transcriptional regulator